MVQRIVRTYFPETSEKEKDILIQDFNGKICPVMSGYHTGKYIQNSDWFGIECLREKCEWYGNKCLKDKTMIS